MISQASLLLPLISDSQATDSRKDISELLTVKGIYHHLLEEQKHLNDQFNIEAFG
jgi:hypothetical protein